MVVRNFFARRSELDILGDMSGKDDENITDLLVAWRGGDADALVGLMPLVYRKLKEIAGHLMRRENQGHTLHATALVHEVYLQVVDLERINWQDRAHFFAMCARIMRRVLVDHARYHDRDKRGGDAQRVDSVELQNLSSDRAPDLIALDEALSELAQLDAERARVVELRFFGGLGREEIAEVLGVSSATVTRRWRSARAWLLHYLKAESS